MSRMIGRIGGMLMVVVALGGSPPAGADARSDLDSRKRDHENLKREYDSRKSDVEKYLEKSRGLRAFDQEEMDKLIPAMCGLDVERDGDEAHRLMIEMRNTSIERVTKNWDDTLRDFEANKDKVERLTYEIKKLQDQVKSIPEEDAVKSDRSSLLSEIEKLHDTTAKERGKLQADLSSLSNVKKGILNGANNPRIRAAMENGKRQHVDMQRSCHEAEVSLRSGRPDCIMFEKDDCKVIEFKPSTVGESGAESQAKKYLEDVVAKYKDDKRAIDNCKKASDGTPIFRPVGKTYPACSR